MSRELAVIVPVVNETATLAGLFRTLAAQRRVDLELVVSDGGSTDGTTGLAHRLGEAAPFPVRVIDAPRGRGRQMNAGAATARGENLLFLHADSVFPHPLALRKGLDALAARLAERGDGRAAGHFALRFRCSNPTPSLGYYYYECKARLHRPDCTLGDQGFLLRREFFDRVGPFDESLPFLEDVRLAARVSVAGEWLLLPAEIHTSARRFETEGLRERQTLNAILMNFAAIGREAFLLKIADLYRSQDRAERLDLPRLLGEINRLIHALPLRERLVLWYATGAYVRGHAWQIPFFLDVRRRFRAGLPPGEGTAPRLALHDRFIAPLSDHAAGRVIAACLTRLWFRRICG